jgi:hypothetical protein
VRIVVVALFVAMVIVAVWGWKAAPSTARFFVRMGNPPGLDGTVSKGTGVLTWLALGALALVGALFADEDNRSMMEILGAVLLAFLLLMEIVSVRRLTR